MAIYHLSLKVGKYNCNIHHDYINRKGSYKNYNKGEDFIYSEDNNLPSWAESGKDYWSQVNLYEKGTQYREIEIALAQEFTDEQNIKLVQDFCKNIFDKNYTYSIGIHKNIGKLSGQENPHAHIMFSERLIDKNRKKEPTKEEYFKQRRKDKITGEYINGYVKDRQITGANRKDWLNKIRKIWEDVQNKHLYKNNITYDFIQDGEHIATIYKSVNCKSLKEQNIDKKPQIHLNPKNVNLILNNKTSETIKQYKEIEQTNKYILENQKEILKLEKYASTISKNEEDISQCFFKNMIVKEKIVKLKDDIKEEKELIFELKERISRNDSLYKELKNITREIQEYQDQLAAIKVLNKATNSKEYIQYSNNLKRKKDILKKEEFITYVKDEEKKLFIDMIKEARENISKYEKELDSYQKIYDSSSDKISLKRKENEEISNKFNKEYIQKNIPLTDFEIQQMQNQINEILNPTIKINRKSWDLER